MGVELQDDEVREVRREDLDDGHGRGVVAAQHEREEPGSPPARDLVARGVELLAWRRAVGQHAIADVGQRQIVEVAVEDR